MDDPWDAEAIRIVGLCRRLHDVGVYSFSNGEAHDRVAAALRAAYEQGVEDSAGVCGNRGWHGMGDIIRALKEQAK